MYRRASARKRAPRTHGWIAVERPARARRRHQRKWMLASSNCWGNFVGSNYTTGANRIRKSGVKHSDENSTFAWLSSNQRRELISLCMMQAIDLCRTAAIEWGKAPTSIDVKALLASKPSLLDSRMAYKTLVEEP